MKNSFSLNRLLSRFFHRFRYFWLRGYERYYPPGLVFSFFFVSAVSVLCVLFGSVFDECERYYYFGSGLLFCVVVFSVFDCLLFSFLLCFYFLYFWFVVFISRLIVFFFY